MDSYIRDQLKQQFLKIKHSFNNNKILGQSTPTESVIALAIESYIQENKDTDLMEKPKLVEHFARHAIHQIRLFLFAGNDSTSSTIVYIFHLLSQNPKALAEFTEGTR
jgi:hypothetical protein